MKKLLLTTLISFLVITAYAQLDVSNKILGDNSFKKKDYYAAAYFYKKAADNIHAAPEKALPYRSQLRDKVKPKDVNTTELYFMLAESYRMYDNYLDAEPWYYKVVTEKLESKYPLARLWYGVCLRADQHFDESIKQLKQFLDGYNGDAQYISLAKKEIHTCEFAKAEYEYPALIEPVKMKGVWNADGSNYALTKRDGSYVFTSSRMIKDDKRHLNRIYKISGDNQVIPEMVTFKKDEKKNELEYGTSAMDPTGKRMYLSRWYKDGAKTIYGIYLSELKNGEWGTPVKLNSNINVDGFKSIQPFITADGKRMFFVSNKPGGQGGDDIWVSNLDDNGMPTNSSNLGRTINTPYDEEAPYFEQSTKRLIYSSKGFTGLGGFDFFESTDNITSWSEAKNMGYPMNSAKDDIYYYPDKNDAKKFYVSSDRESDCCLDLFEMHDKRHELGGIVIDCETNKPLDSARVSFIDSLTQKVLKEEIVSADGKYSFSVKTTRPYNIKLEHKGYFTKVLSIPSSGRMVADTLVNADVCLQPFKVNKPMVIKNILYDFNSANLRDESKTVLNDIIKILKDNPKIKIELAAHTDSIGSDAYNNKLSQDRAQACVDYITQNGIITDRIFAKGYGKTKPIAPNSLPNGKDNPDGRQLNRRTEFTVLKLE
ncbi:OmpA family protein [Mucilaginibacter sp. dw_454]|uniref:OmpA family protein n=1 Tax=Mucilaginibacter sp. dw_454 TaxID=2720079 RepID=UPI001BD5F319|nr:OmpA family protein [Mucilaginibacter sp. dw_454]